ncbi:MAG: TrpR-like protein YerC/YecD [Oscillospiraceae bacterium]|nr:TrpR-like protein YerC/YecD [Oscillospiraceae bacterium]
MYESKMKSAQVDRLFAAIRTLKSEEECYRFFEDLCTFNELQSMAQRMEVAALLNEGKTFAQISELTGVSSATITRVNRCIGYGTGGYRTVLERMEK